MYYGYIHQLDTSKKSKQYIGFCVLLNGVMLNNFRNLFSLFENTITNLVLNGDIIGFNDVGEIVSNVTKLHEKKAEADRITDIIRNSMLTLKSDFNRLPPLNYAIANDVTKIFSVNDDDASIAKATCVGGYSYICKSEDFNIQSLNAYKGILSRLNKEKKDALDKYNKLSDVFQQLLREKKQYKKIIFLCLLVSIGVVGLYFLSDNLSGIKQHNLSLKSSIFSLNSVVQEQRVKIDKLESLLTLATEEKKVAEENLSIVENYYNSITSDRNRMDAYKKSNNRITSDKNWVDVYERNHIKGVVVDRHAVNTREFNENYFKSKGISTEKGHDKALEDLVRKEIERIKISNNNNKPKSKKSNRITSDRNWMDTYIKNTLVGLNVDKYAIENNEANEYYFKSKGIPTDKGYDAALEELVRKETEHWKIPNNNNNRPKSRKSK